MNSSVSAVEVLAQESADSGLGVFLPLVLLFGLAVAFALFSVLLGPLFGPSRYNKAKVSAYECGIEPSPQPLTGGGRMPIAYYVTAMLFILFDIEMVFLFPYAVSADLLGLWGVAAVSVFIATFFIADIYVWRRGGLDWN
ncbi:NADH-quinone oxidoreductase subunit A [Saccharomonospora viridis]|uniref:NADH-quinone oxidoreductase subunit n=2 Tax=Saccharomonospora viridis TaxID=1852 RepID=C7MTC7_SACVD|nr:NADH-quinone oxidoreductase subunit A [Saccharomonospora viridis]ACU95397.1 NADH dehydrogenase subunit A [Saccharomonospora viridis DSM 43017]KHF45029.1 NADH dehydrogenase subunit A [Saccharomonospora viridis]SFP15094.1 NADH-quinone oxidoreductase subunit A [Saccharomonospora viridis]